MRSSSAPYVSSAAQSRPRPRATRRSRATSRSSAGGIVRRTPISPASMSRGRGHPGEQGDLRVPVLDRETGAEPQPPAGLRPATTSWWGRRGSCRRGRAGGPAAAGRPRASSWSGSTAVPPVERPLHRRVVLLLPAAHECPAYVGVQQLAVAVEVERPHQRGPGLAGQQGRGALAEARRVAAGCGGPVRTGSRRERCASVSTAPPRRDEGGDVGDRVPDPVAGIGALDARRPGRGRATRAGRGWRTRCRSGRRPAAVAPPQPARPRRAQRGRTRPGPAARYGPARTRRAARRRRRPAGEVAVRHPRRLPTREPGTSTPPFGSDRAGTVALPRSDPRSCFRRAGRAAARRGAGCR